MSKTRNERRREERLFYMAVAVWFVCIVILLTAKAVIG